MGVECTQLVGGVPISANVATLKERPHVVVGTLGRVFDLINRNLFGENLMPSPATAMIT